METNTSAVESGGSVHRLMASEGPAVVLLRGGAQSGSPGDARKNGSDRRSAETLEREAGRRALREAAAREVDASVESIVIGSTAAGAPRAWLWREFDGAPVTGPHVSLSHRDGRVAAVADGHRRVGVDLERLVAVGEESARYYLTERERRRTAPDRATLWALKEASWKALECADSTPFTMLELEFDDDNALRAVWLAGTRLSAGATVLSPWPGYVLAVVWLEEDAV